MLLKKYTHFHNEFLNENVDAAKTFMKNFYLKKKREKEPGTPEKPTGIYRKRRCDENPDANSGNNERTGNF